MIGDHQNAVPPGLEEAVNTLGRLFGGIDTFYDAESKDAAIYIRASKTDNSNKFQAMAVLRLKNAEQGWKATSFKIGISLWATLRGLGIDVSDIEHT